MCCCLELICNISDIIRLCCFNTGGAGARIGASAGTGAGSGSCSIWECCAMIYCYMKVKKCCIAMGTKISNCCESTKNNIKICYESTKNNIKSGCESITDVCSNTQTNNTNIDDNITLAGTGQIDSAEEYV